MKGSKRRSISGASRPLRLPIVAYGRVIVRDQRAEAEQPLIVPMRPMATAACATPSVWINRQPLKVKQHGMSTPGSGAADRCRCDARNRLKLMDLRNGCNGAFESKSPEGLFL